MIRSLFLFCFASFILFQSSAQKQENPPEIISRDAWGAKDPVLEMTAHTPSYITIHHTGMPQKPGLSIQQKLQGLQAFSQKDSKMAGGGIKKAWADVPYHFYIATSGEIAEGRDINFQGDSNTDYNLDGHVLIVVEGDFNKEKLLPAQWKSLKKLVTYISEEYQIPLSTISGHKDQAETSCPGDELYGRLAELRIEERVIVGAERILEPQFFQHLKGRRVGLITNHTGKLPNGEYLVDLLHNHPQTDLSILFGPEHGIRGEEDTHVANSVDNKTGLQVISLYGKIQKPTSEMLKNIDILIFDIQDIGARYYTYIRTMLYAMEAAAENDVDFMVLDRPNPISGIEPAGPIGEALGPVQNIESLPVVHDMSIGELAEMFNKERKKAGKPMANLTVVGLKNYSRELLFDETGLAWIKPSPNMLNLTTALLYPATCLLEGTNYSEGRGTLHPFEYIGAPWVEPTKLSEALNSYALPGVKFEPVNFKPKNTVDGIKIYPPKFMEQEVPGVKIIITQRAKLQPVELGIHILYVLKDLYPEQFEWKKSRIDHLLKTSEVREMLDQGKSPNEIIQKWKQPLEHFKLIRRNYLRYP